MKKNNKPSILSELIKKITKKTILDNAEKEKEKAYDIRKIYEQMELDLISSMKRAFYYHQREQDKEGFVWEQWQLTKLREFEAYRKRNKNIVGKYNKPIQKAIDSELRGNFANGENRVTRLIERIKNLFSKKQEQPDITIDLPKDLGNSISMKAPQENAFFGTNEKKLEALISTVQNDLNKASYSVLRKMDDVYRQTLFKTHVYMQNGTKTLNQAIDMATKDFLDKGVNSIEYKNGARVNIASYAEMCLRTASQRATFLGEGKKRNEYGVYTVVVSAHANTCKHCAVWQGKILIDDVFSGGSAKDAPYPILSQAIKENFLHPNCRHTLITYFPGITRLPEVPNTDKAIELYNNEQKQRYYERQIRKWKRIEAGSLDAKSVNDAAKRVKESETQLKKLLDNNKQLRRAPQREENKVPVEDNGKSGILINKKWLKANFSTQKKFDRHIEKHLSEYGDMTSEDYANTARDLLAAPLSNDVEGFVSEANFIYKYRHSTNDLAIGRNDKNIISTLYKPIKGYEEFINERKLFEKKG